VKSLLRPALVLFAALTILTGLVYPLAVTGIGKLLFPLEAAGSLVLRDGKIVGSTLIGQSFSDPKYFWGRVSATSPMPYNGASSTGSNFAPTNPALLEAVGKRIEALRAADPDNKLPIPVDLVTSSASGLDPDESPAAALYQVARVARARHMDVAKVRQLVLDHIEAPQWHIFGEPRVNVLTLNLSVDRAQ
jgi:K+-transporting ATPase ATPase C chain